MPLEWPLLALWIVVNVSTYSTISHDDKRFGWTLTGWMRFLFLRDKVVEPMIYQFDNCTFDTQRFELSCAGQPVALRRKAFQLLTYLLLNGDRVVPKDELVDHLWPDQFIGDAALNSCLREVRRAIGDNGQAQRIIRTIRGSGYRIVVPILIENHALGTDSPGIERAAPELTP